MAENKVAFITGGTRGIGKEIALELSNNGFDIAINYISENEENIEILRNQLKENGAKSFFVKGDVSNFEDCEKMTEEIIKEFGKIDVLVNNAGITRDGLILRMKKEDFNSVINVNLVGTFNVTRNVIPYMVKQKIWKNNKSCFSSRSSWKCRSNQLFCIKSRNNRIYKEFSKRSRK